MLFLSTAMLLLLSLSFVVLPQTHKQSSPRTYTVPQVLSMFWRNRSALAGEIIQVAGVWSVCKQGFCPNEPFLGNRVVQLDGGLAIGFTPENPRHPWYALLQHTSLFRRLMPYPPQPVENSAAIYRVRLLGSTTCLKIEGAQMRVCYDAWLLGAHKIDAVLPGMYLSPVPETVRVR